MLTEMVRLLAEHPEEWRRVQSDPSRVDKVVEETLRLSTPTQGMFRIATRDVTLGGVDIPAGARLVVIYSSANRDEAVFVDPDAFDPDRTNLKEHLAFGKGIHFCLGAALSRLEGQVALQRNEARVEHLGGVSLEFEFRDHDHPDPARRPRCAGPDCYAPSLARSMPNVCNRSSWSSNQMVW